MSVFNFSPRGTHARTARLCATSVVGAVLLAGCGGDSGYGYGYDYGCGYDAFGNPLVCSSAPLASASLPVASAETFAPAQALVNAATQAFSFTVSSVDSVGNSYTISNVSVPGAATTFNGAMADSAVLTQNFFENGVAVSADSTTSYYDPATDALLGSGGQFPGEFEVVTTFQPAPAAGSVGQSFPRLTANLYHDSTQTVLDGTFTETLGIQADTATTALVCLEDSVQLTASGIADGLSSVPSSTCYRVNASGALLGLQLSTAVNGNLLTFQ